MINIKYKIRFIWLIVVAISIIASGCFPQTAITNGMTTDETKSIIIETVAPIETVIPPNFTPTMSIEQNDGEIISAPADAVVVTDWWGVIISNPSGAQFDDYFERRDSAQIIDYGIDSADPAISAQIKELRDSGKTIHLYGLLVNNVLDVNGSQIQPDRIEVSDAAGGWIPPGTSEPISDWWGVIRSTPCGAQFDDYFERQDLGQIIYLGIDSTDPTIKAQIEALRDSGTIVHLYGSLISNITDLNGSQVQVEKIEY